MRAFWHRLWRWGWRAASALLLTAAGLAGAVWLGLPRVPLYPEGMTWSRVVTARDGHVLELTRTADDQYRAFVPLAEVARPLREATIAYEDSRFDDHGGVDARALARSLYGILTGRRAGGASTLTMQLARMRFGLSTRTLPGKFVQMLRAWQLEKFYDKEQLLEAYLNMAPYGGNVQGIGAASYIYAGKPASALTRAESLRLAMMPQNPSKRRPGHGAEDERQTRARKILYERLIATKGWRRDPLTLACRLSGSAEAPHEARHFCRRLLSEHEGRELRSTLDRELQQALERAAASVSLPSGGNLSLLLIHAPTRETLAYVGSSDFFDVGRFGQVDGNAGNRSPGSLLKPFLYARALDEGLLCPDTLLGDVPARYADWKPENYRRLFRGPVRARDALRESLNLPAIALMERVTPFYLYELLEKLGVPLRPRGSYGLTLALGSAEMTPCDLARLYAALADDGYLRPLKTLIDSGGEEHGGMPPSQWSEAARFLALEMLYRPQDGCSWKTGTSQNWRDGWIAAVRGDYVLVVWTGSFSGGGGARYVGGDMAYSLMKRCWERALLPERVRDAPEDVREVELCALSGDLPGEFCPHRIRGRYIAGVSSLKRCSMHRPTSLPDETAANRESAEKKENSGSPHVREIWPVELAAHFARMGIPLRGSSSLPTVREPGQAPRILSPLAGRRYLTVDGAGAPANVTLQADAAPGVKTLYWFLDREFLGAAAPGEPLVLAAREGAFTLSVVDDRGRAATLNLVFSQP